MSCILTDKGKERVEDFVSEWEAKRKEIIDARKDTVDEVFPMLTAEDILSDIEFIGIDNDGYYVNGWAVSDSGAYDIAISLEKDVDFVEV